MLITLLLMELKMQLQTKRGSDKIEANHNLAEVMKIPRLMKIIDLQEDREELSKYYTLIRVKAVLMK